MQLQLRILPEIIGPHSQSRRIPLLSIRGVHTKNDNYNNNYNDNNLSFHTDKR